MKPHQIVMLVGYFAFVAVLFTVFMKDDGHRTLGHEKLLVFFLCLFWPLTMLCALFMITKAEFEIALFNYRKSKRDE